MQVDVARVTWVSVYTLDHFIICALDSRSVITLWDSKAGFSPIFRFYSGCEEPFDLVLTQDFMVVIQDNMSANRLDLFFWKLWLHPDFEESRQRTFEPTRQGMVEICHDCSLRKTPTRGFCAEVTTAGWSSICTSRWRCSSSSSWDRPRCRFGSGFCSCTAKWRCVAALSVQRTSTKLSPDQDAQPSRCRHLFRLVQEFPQCLLLSQIGPGIAERLSFQFTSVAG